MSTPTDITLIGALAAIWLAAGLLADGLPAARTAAEMRRRAMLLSTLVGAGAVVFLAAPMITTVVDGPSGAPVALLLSTVPVAIVLTTTRRRLAKVRHGAAALQSAPVPPGLIATAAHPLIAAPLQVAGLATLVGLPLATGLVGRPDDVIPSVGLASIVLTAAGLAVTAIAVRHSLRHSRLSVGAITPLKRLP